MKMHCYEIHSCIKTFLVAPSNCATEKVPRVTIMRIQWGVEPMSILWVSAVTFFLVVID